MPAGRPNIAVVDLAEVSGRSHSAPRARRATGARYGVVVASGRGRRHCAEPPISVQPATYPDPSGRATQRSFGSDRRWLSPAGRGFAVGDARLSLLRWSQEAGAVAALGLGSLQALIDLGGIYDLFKADHLAVL